MSSETRAVDHAITGVTRSEDAVDHALLVGLEGAGHSGQRLVDDGTEVGEFLAEFDKFRPAGVDHQRLKLVIAGEKLIEVVFKTHGGPYLCPAR